MKLFVKKFTFTCFFLICINSTGFSQEVSPLFQYNAISPGILKDPELFDMYTYIRQEEKKKGALDSYSDPYEIFSNLRQAINSFEIQFDTSGNCKQDTIVCLVQVSKSIIDSFYIPRTYNKQQFKSGITSSLKKTVAFFFEQYIPTLKSNPESSRMKLNKILLIALCHSLDIKHRDKDKINSKLGFFISEELYTNLENGIIFNDKLKSLDKKYINGRIHEYTNSFRDFVIDRIDLLEVEFQNAEKESKYFFVAGNAGLGVTGDESNLGAGIYSSIRTYIKTTEVEIGGFCNGAGEITSEDSLLNQPFLIGLSIKLAFDSKIQLNVLGAQRILTNVESNQTVTTEIGGGILFKVNHDLVLGASGYYQFLDNIEIENQKIPSIWNFGLTAQSTQKGSPVFMIGIVKGEQTNAKLSFQISYPIMGGGN